MELIEYDYKARWGMFIRYAQEEEKSGRGLPGSGNVPSLPLQEF